MRQTFSLTLKMLPTFHIKSAWVSIKINGNVICDLYLAFHLGKCFWSLLWYVPVLHSSLWLRNILLNEYTTFSFFI